MTRAGGRFRVTLEPARPRTACAAPEEPPVPEPRLRAVLVDDEAPARALLREYLGAHADVEIVAECANGFEAVKTIGELAPDLVFLDVQMPKLDGFEVLELIAPGPAVVFCTAYDEYALRAFEVHAVDYLLKPFGRERLAEALARVRERRGARRHGAAPAPRGGRCAARRARRRGAPAGHFAERVIVKDGAEIHVIPVDADRLPRGAGRLRRDPRRGEDAGSSSSRCRSSRRRSIPRASCASTARTCVQLERIARLEPYAKDSRVAVLKDGPRSR